MILGLAKREQSGPLETRKAAAGIYVVASAYTGTYEYFETEPNPVSQDARPAETPPTINIPTDDRAAAK